MRFKIWFEESNLFEAEEENQISKRFDFAKASLIKIKSRRDLIFPKPKKKKIKLRRSLICLSRRE